MQTTFFYNRADGVNFKVYHAGALGYCLAWDIGGPWFTVASGLSQAGALALAETFGM